MRIVNSLITVLALSLTSLSIGCAIGTDEIEDEYSDAESSAAAPGKLDLYRSGDNQWRFRVNSGNGRILMSSEAYTTRTNAINGILSVLDNGVDPAMYTLNQSTANGKYNLRLRAANHQIIAFTQQYSTKASAKRAIGSCVNAITSYLDRAESNTGARVNVKATATGKWHFNIHGQDGSILLLSEQYSTEALAWNGAFAVQAAAANDRAFTVKTATDGRPYFTITAQNGQIVAVSKLFAVRTDIEAAVASTKAMLASLDIL
jgi:uncharacterized protein